MTDKIAFCHQVFTKRTYKTHMIVKNIHLPHEVVLEPSTPAAIAPWNKDVCLSLIEQLWSLRTSMLEREVELQPELGKVAIQHQGSARNLIHYLALRSVDLRPLQSQLTWLGLSSLGRSESHVLANLDKVLGILHRLTGRNSLEMR